METLAREHKGDAVPHRAIRRTLGPSPLDTAAQQRDQNILHIVEEAVRHREVRLAFQPVVQAQEQGHVAFYEGLIRVTDPTGRIIPAGQFIDSIEERESGRLLDCLSLEHGLRTLSQNPGLRLAINLSARSIGYPKWRKVLERGLSRDGTVAERLILEITEASAMLVPELVVQAMRDLQKLGISFALDDFGAGYTALRYLKEFQFDILKIDGQFIRGIATDTDNQVLTRAIIAIAQQFDMFTVAEFVESAPDAHMLGQLGVDFLQGYYFGAPTVEPPWQTIRTSKVVH
ncbi:EAL domain-containing protein [Marivita cryptomonadis]|uniref:EAL domain-containing protein n=1 Tax=Marivita cryptomonadis TaxID=505252 RepID=A0A9Q2S683_9RHOB|nr:EAL domain-containing protein [Marivita cryptomonadis]MBM2332522.1 EAL domain-containing protein [Marivita cryptomonadis]MBM2342105.1 EAL domain-containing protein [Marivita cryptomonadis]MBM2346756.1 EAL domain-containing protein [Marivita cryptomonadis]MBM2351433.1 EAL domain-containing protein [Marivita cryptomonadis]